MNISYTLHKEIALDVKEKAQIDRKMQSAVRMLGRTGQIVVEISPVRHNKIRVDVVVTSPKGKFQTREENSRLIDAVDIVEEELKRQIVKAKEKNQTLERRGGRSIKKKAVIDENARF